MSELCHAVFCVSVDSAGVESPSAETLRRAADTAELLQQLRVPSSWTLDTPQRQLSLPPRSQSIVRLPSSVDSRGHLVRLLRGFHARFMEDGQSLSAVAADPYQARTYWDVFIRQRCFVVRPRLSEPTRTTSPQRGRGGLWSIPVSCSFAGGSHRTIRSQLAICHRRLLTAASQRGFFHLSIDVGNERTSWDQEHDALRAFLRTATEQHRSGSLQFAMLGELSAVLAAKRATAPLRSILRTAALVRRPLLTREASPLALRSSRDHLEQHITAVAEQNTVIDRLDRLTK